MMQTYEDISKINIRDALMLHEGTLKIFAAKILEMPM